MKKSDVLFVFSRIINDGVMIFLGLCMAYFLRMYWFEIFNIAPPTTLFPLDLFYIFAFKFSFVLVIIFALNGRYNFYTDEKIWDELFHIFWTFSAGMALILVLFFFAKFTFFSRFIFGVAWISGLVFILAGRMGLRFIREKFYQSGIGRVRILVLGSGKLANRALKFLKNSHKFEIIGVLTESSGKKEIHGQKVLGTFEDFESILKAHSPHEVLLATEDPTQQISHKLVRIAHICHTKFRFLPDELGLDLASVDISTLGDLPLVTLRSTKIEGWGLVIKTSFDFLVSGIATIVLSPLLGIIAWKVKKEYPEASLLYRSKRVGKNGKEFDCFKFRTMIPDAEKQKGKLLSKNQRQGGVLFKMENDPRITPLGATLRKWSLDELPQLWNVLRGEMSLIGPRPHLPEEVKKYGKNDLLVLGVKPGITGFAQINGRSNLSFQEEMEYELFYLKNWNLKLDIIIFLKSIFVVVKKENAS